MHSCVIVQHTMVKDQHSLNMAMKLICTDFRDHAHEATYIVGKQPESYQAHLTELVFVFLEGLQHKKSQL